MNAVRFCGLFGLAAMSIACSACTTDRSVRNAEKSSSAEPAPRHAASQDCRAKPNVEGMLRTLCY
jgi:Flp pilus assembly protein TadD